MRLNGLKITGRYKLLIIKKIQIIINKIKINKIMKKVKALIIAAVMLVCGSSLSAQSENEVKNLNYDRGYRFDIELSCSSPPTIL